MTTTRPPPPDTQPPRNRLALWAGLTALFTNLAAINVIALIGDETDPGVTAIAALITAVMTAAAVYTRQRMSDEKARHPQPPSPPEP